MPTKRKLAAALLLGTALWGASAAAAFAADGVLVSRETGADGAPFAFVTLVDNTRDGRFVLFSASGVGLVVRDRVANTSTLLATTGDPLDLSDDGQTELARDPATSSLLLVPTGGGQERTLVAATPAATPTGYARLVGGGTGVVYGTVDADGVPSIRRVAVSGGAPTLVKSGLELRSASRDGQVMTWRHPLVEIQRPTSPYGPGGGPQVRGGTAVGYLIAGQEPKVVARTSVKEVRDPASNAACGIAGIDIQSFDPKDLQTDDSGARLWLAHDDRDPSDLHATYTHNWAVRGPGDVGFTPTTATLRDSIHPLFLNFNDVGETGRRVLLVTLTLQPESYLTTGDDGSAAVAPLPPGLASAPASFFREVRFFGRDTGVLANLYGYRPGFANGIYAYDPATPAPTGLVPSGTPTASPADTADSASLKPDVTWWECPDPRLPLPVASAASYASIYLTTPVRSGLSAGLVTVHPAPPGGYRAASRITVQVSTFGIPTFTKSFATNRDVALPKPFAWLPQSVRATISIPASGAAPAQQLAQSAHWQAKQ